MNLNSVLMRRFHAFVSVAVMTLFCLTSFAFAVEIKNEPQKTDELKQTVVTCVAGEKIEASKNYIYCSTFQYAWNILCTSILKEALLLAGAPEYAKTLNAAMKEKPNVSEQSYLAMAGFGGENIVKKINEGLSDKFGGDAPGVSERLGPEDIIAYAYLYKNLEFAKKFEAPKNFLSIKFNEKWSQLDSFGIDNFSDSNDAHADLSRQVDILFYEEGRGFVIRLNSKSLNDEIIISTLEAKDTLLAAYDSIISVINEKPQKLVKGDRMVIPKIDFNLLHSFKELVNKKVLNKGFTKYLLTKAEQGIKFKLNEKGAILKSEAKIVMTKAAMIPSIEHDLRVKGPFFLIMKEKASRTPYFMLRVANDELLVKKQ